jgi:hypothetical protein
MSMTREFLTHRSQGLASWFYKGQIEITELLQCESVIEAVSIVVAGGTLDGE